MKRVHAATIAIAIVAMVAPSMANAATTSYAGSFEGHPTSSLTFDLVAKKTKRGVKRTVKNVEMKSAPAFCENGPAAGTSGPLDVTARVGRDERFVGTGDREYAIGWISHSYMRGEFRQRRTLAAGRLISTARGQNQEGFIDCSTGFLDWIAERVPAGS